MYDMYCKELSRTGSIMGSSSSIMRPQELVEFRKLNTSIDDVDIPAKPENRTLTDRKGFIIYGVALLILLPFLIYALANSDIRHLDHGTDNCGNFCGVKNIKIDGIECSGQDYTDLPYSDSGKCVEFCNSWQGVCISDSLSSKRFNKRSLDNYGSVSEDDYNVVRRTDITDGLRESGRQWWKYLFTIFITISMAISTLVLLRYTPAPLVWGIVIFSMVALLVITIGAWILYMEVSSQDSPDQSGFSQNYPKHSSSPAAGLLVLTVGWTIIAVIVLVVFVVLFKKIGLVIQLYKETTKVLAAMPMIVFVPILFALIQIIILALGVLTTFLMICSRELMNINDDFYVYSHSGVVIFTIIYNIVMVAWTMRLVAGIQFMIVSGSASTWYFSRNKDYMDSPICTNFKITFKYHLGTIAFGSFLLTLFAVVKAILRGIFRNACCRCFFLICCNNMEVILRFLSENSYIQTGLHGQSFLRSAKRATKLLITNAASVIAINCVGEFVLGMIVFLVSVLATAVSFAMFSDMGAQMAILPTIICFFVNVMIVAVVFSSFSTIIDTLFICFCEDSILNDGISRPYYMSRGLMEFVENSKKVYGKENNIVR